MVTDKTYEEVLKEQINYIRFIASTLNTSDYEIQKELIQVGRIGLLTAYNKFEPERGVPFKKYMIWHIKGVMLQHLADNARTIRIPQHIKTEINKGLKDPIKKIQSLSLPLGKFDLTLGDVIEDPFTSDMRHLKDEKDWLYHHINKVSPKHKEMLIQYYGLYGQEPIKQKELGKMMGMSKQAISLNIIKAKAELKAIIEDAQKKEI